MYFVLRNVNPERARIRRKSPPTFPWPGHLLDSTFRAPFVVSTGYWHALAAAQTQDVLQRATVGVWMHHVHLGGDESVWSQSPTGRCWDPTGWVRIDGSQRLVLPLAAPVTRFRTPSSQSAGSKPLARPTTAHGLGPLASLASCFPVARLCTWGALGAETGQTPRQLRCAGPMTAPSSPVANS